MVRSFQKPVYALPGMVTTGIGDIGLAVNGLRFLAAWGLKSIGVHVRIKRMVGTPV
jgi:hypothetical protein